MIAPISTEAVSSAPVFIACRRRISVSDSASGLLS